MTQCLQEQLRLDQLDKLKILDSPADPHIDRLTKIAQAAYKVDIALVSLVDETRQWFKSAQGIDTRETAREIAFCHHAIQDDEIFVVEDASRHPKFRDNPLVTQAPYIRFYAGVPLHEPLGFKIGTLCIIDNVPRTVNREALVMLKNLAQLIEEHIANTYCATRRSTVLQFPKLRTVDERVRNINNNSRQSTVQQLLNEVLQVTNADLGLVCSIDESHKNISKLNVAAISDPGNLRSPMRMAKAMAQGKPPVIECDAGSNYHRVIETWLRDHVLAISDKYPNMIHLPVMSLGKLVGLVCLIFERKLPSAGLEYALSPLFQTLAILLEKERLTELQHKYQQPQRHDMKDPLTGLPNLNQAMIELDNRIKGPRNNHFCIYLLDADNFFEFNRIHGTQVGDQVLKTFAQRLQQAVNKGDYLAHVGGDEFLVISGAPFNRAFITEVTEQHCRDLCGHAITLSIGTASFPGDSTSAEQLMRFAANALFDAKVKGKQRVERFDQNRHQKNQQTVSLRDEINRAIDNNEFELFYQPKVTLDDGQVAGFEALLRWHHPEKGLLYPDTFLPAIQHTDLEFKLGRFVSQAAGKALHYIEQQQLDYRLSINISPRHFLDEGFVAELRDCLSACGEAFRENLVLEIVETAALENKQVALEAIKSCQSLGMKVSLDDFGKGYSSLSYFRELPWDEVKIDRSFVFNLLSVTEDAMIVESVINLCKRFGRQVVAEGIESEEHAQKLQELGCAMGQGFWYSKALPLNAALEWAQQHTARAPHAQRSG